MYFSYLLKEIYFTNKMGGIKTFILTQPIYYL